VPVTGDDDVFEAVYMAKLRALLTPHGLEVSYGKDRAAIDTGLHLFVVGPSGMETMPNTHLVPGER
jgi:hypothetical protein